MNKNSFNSSLWCLTLICFTFTHRFWATSYNYKKNTHPADPCIKIICFSKSDAALHSCSAVPRNFNKGYCCHCWWRKKKISNLRNCFQQAVHTGPKGNSFRSTEQKLLQLLLKCLNSPGQVMAPCLSSFRGKSTANRGLLSRPFIAD